MATPEPNQQNNLKTERWSTTILRALLALIVVCAIVYGILAAVGLSTAQIGEMFAHPVSGGVRQPDAAPVVPPEAEVDEAVLSFGTLNYIVLSVYLALMLFIGYRSSRKITGTRSFFIADGRLNHVLVGFSLLGTYLSALTMMALSGMSFGAHDFTYVIQLPFLIVTAIVITRFVLPRYRESGVISVYEFLERRIHVSIRLLASASFVIFSIARMGLLLFLPALAFSIVTGASLPLCIVMMGIFITAYTLLGGIEAVVWTDAIQVVIFVAGAAVSLAYIFGFLGTEQFIDIGSMNQKFRFIIPSLDVTKITSLWLIMETIFQTIRIFGTQQDMTQRYMTTESTAKANRSVWISIIAYIPLGFVFYFIGVALFTYYQANPDPAVAGLRPDSIYPHFIVTRLPAGLAGLVIAAIFAAAMSSVDSLMNSSCTVCIEDFFKRFSRKARTDQSWLLRARFLTLLWGVLAIGMGIMFIHTVYAQILWGQIMGIATNGILGLMLLALLPFRVNKWAALFGFAISYGVLFMMITPATAYHAWPLAANAIAGNLSGGLSITLWEAFNSLITFLAGMSQINFLLWPIVGNSVCFLAALVFNPLLTEASPEIAAAAEPAKTTT